MRGLVSFKQQTSLSKLFDSPDFLTIIKGGTAPTFLGEQFRGK